jgi:isochorismate pyruvate lyase
MRGRDGRTCGPIAGRACLSRMSLPCQSLEEVREQIDRLDRRMVALLAERGEYVRQAARFKKTTQDVAAPARVEQVIAKVRGLAGESGADAEVIEKVYRAMIAAFIEAERKEHARLNG